MFPLIACHTQIHLASIGVRVAIGAGPDTRDAPQRVEDYVPSKEERGFFDRKK